MPLNPGNRQLTFTPPGRFVKDKYHTVPASDGLSPFDQIGCMMQPLTVKDKVENTAYADATDKVFTPWNSNIALVEAEWYVTDAAANNYRVIGDESTADAYDRIFQGVFIVKKETG